MAKDEYGAWKSDREYRYVLHTRTLAAVPHLKNHWTGLITKADLTIKPQSKDVLIGKLQNTVVAEWDDELVNGWNQPLPERDLRYKSMNMDTKPFEIRLDNGAIHSVAVDKSMTNTELNHLKGIVSQLQVDIRGRNLMKHRDNQMPNFNDEKNENSQPVFKVMEPTVTGKCETLYDIVKLPKYLAQTYPEYNHNHIDRHENDYFYEITKTKNYTNCEQRVGYHFGISGSNDWTVHSNTMGSLSKSAISRIVITGAYNDYTIRSSTTTNRVVKQNPSKY